MHGVAKQDELRRVAEDVKNTRERQHLVEVEEKSGEGNEEDRRAKAGDRPRDFGDKREQQKQQS